MSHNQSYYTVMLVTGSLQFPPCCQGIREAEEKNILFKNARSENYAKNREVRWKWIRDNLDLYAVSTCT